MIVRYEAFHALDFLPGRSSDLVMKKTDADEKILLEEAVELFSAKSRLDKNLLPKLKEKIPGYSDSQYVSAYSRVEALFDRACKLVFQWTTENPPGATFELPDKERVFVDELAKDCDGFSEEEYNVALAYGFEMTIF
ncbi:MAG: hypothetical protein C0469_09930 [Cyanobacteria bacterium DS2.3.42]|nr:hypothetical protein [Cyanobacteria bacterium DS2.3.42]